MVMISCRVFLFAQLSCKRNEQRQKDNHSTDSNTSQLLQSILFQQQDQRLFSQHVEPQSWLHEESRKRCLQTRTNIRQLVIAKAYGQDEVLQLGKMSFQTINPMFKLSDMLLTEIATLWRLKRDSIDMHLLF